MDIPLELLIDYMDYLNPELRISKRDMWVNGIKMMPEVGRLYPNYVYFAQYNGSADIREGAVLVLACPKDVTVPDEQDNCIILHTDVPITVIFNEMLGLQTLIRDWEQEVELSISRREGVQRLLDISGRVFGNPLVIITTSFRTIAATWEYDTDDPMFWELLELGYLTQKTFTSLQKNGYFNSDNLTNGTVVHEPNDVVSAVSTVTAISHEGAVVFMVLMLCKNNPLSRGLRQLYELFIEKLKYFLQPAAIFNESLRNQQDKFLLDIIEGRVSTTLEIAERSLVYPPAFTTEYQTVVISHESNSAMYLEHAMNNLSALFPTVRQLQYGSMILLHPDLSASDTRRANFIDTLTSYLHSVHAFAGISDPNIGLVTLRESYRQARQALDLGRQLASRGRLSENMLENTRREDRIFYFRDYHLYSMLSGKERDLGLLDKIRKYDFDNNTNYYQILYIFLSLERSYTKVAAILHMHRNNVIYHTKRMEEIFSLDLDDPAQRLRLLMLYRLSDILPE